MCTYALCMRGRVTHTSGRVTRPPSGHEFRKRSLARGKGSKKRSAAYIRALHTVEREKGGFFCMERFIYSYSAIEHRNE